MIRAFPAIVGRIDFGALVQVPEHRVMIQDLIWRLVNNVNVVTSMKGMSDYRLFRLFPPSLEDPSLEDP